MANQNCLINLTEWTDTVDSNPLYGTINTNKCGTKTYNIIKSVTNPFLNSVSSLITLSGTTITVHPVASDPPGTFDFDLVVSINSNQAVLTFSVTLNCTPNLSALPVINDTTVIAMVQSSTVAFSTHQGRDCNNFSYAVVFLNGTGMTASVDYSSAKITFNSMSLAQVGSFQYKLVLKVIDQTFESNTATLTVTNPCIQTIINDQAIDFSSLIAGYQE